MEEEIAALLGDSPRTVAAPANFTIQRGPARPHAGKAPSASTPSAAATGVRDTFMIQQTVVK